MFVFGITHGLEAVSWISATVWWFFIGILISTIYGSRQTTDICRSCEVIRWMMSCPWFVAKQKYFIHGMQLWSQALTPMWMKLRTLCTFVIYFWFFFFVFFFKFPSSFLVSFLILFSLQKISTDGIWILNWVAPFSIEGVQQTTSQNLFYHHSRHTNHLMNGPIWLKHSNEPPLMFPRTITIYV